MSPLQREHSSEKATDLIRDEKKGGGEAPEWLRRLPPLAIDAKRLEPLPGVPIKAEDLQSFHEAWLAEGHPKDVLEKLEANLRFISKEQMRQTLEEMADAISAFVGNRPFALYVDDPDKSGGFIASKLLPLLKEREISPTAQLTYFGLEGTQEEKNREKLREVLEPVERVVFVDDASYNGTRASCCLRDVEAIGVPTEKIGAFFIGSTADALELNAKNCGKFWAGLRIPQLKEIFDEETLEDLKHLRILGGRTTWGGLWPEALLTFFHHKVPDNFLGNLRSRITGSDSPHIVDDSREGIHPPYGMFP